MPQADDSRSNAEDGVI